MSKTAVIIFLIFIVLGIAFVILMAYRDAQHFKKTTHIVRKTPASTGIK